MKKRIAATLLAFCMALALLPGTARAAVVDSGVCGADGDNVRWSLDSDRTLTISGAGAMADYQWDDSGRFINTPWYQYRENIQKIEIEDGVTTIGDCAFYYCRPTTVNIPDSVTAIGDLAFSYCRLTTVNIPDSVTAIGDLAFFYCSLTSVNIPDSVTAIGDEVFGWCSSLTSVNIPNSVTAIGGSAFRGCLSLANINIPSSVTAIGDYAFYDCNNLSDVYYSGTEDSWKRLEINSDYYTNAPLFNATIHYNYNGTNPATAHSVKYDPAGGKIATGTLPGVKSYKSGETVNIPSLTQCLPEREGYTFSGWSDGTKTYSPSLVLGASFTMPDHDVVLTALWEAKPTVQTYSVKYEIAGGKVALGALPDVQSYKPGETVNIPSLTQCLPERKGYTFSGWSDGTKTYSPSLVLGASFTMPDHDVVLTALWEAKENLLRYDPNLGIGSGLVPSIPAATGSKIQITSIVPIREGYKFAGWADSDNEQKLYKAGEEYTMPGHDVVLTAQWRKYYTVSYQLPEGATVAQGTLPAPEKCAEKDSFTVTDAKAVRNGYVFKGWNDGTTTYRPGSIFTMPSHDVQLTAICDPDIDGDNVFIQQGKDSVTCTLVATTMMLRRRAILDGDAKWDTITERAVGAVAWGKGLSTDFPYGAVKVKAEAVDKSKCEPEESVFYLYAENPPGRNCRLLPWDRWSAQ